MPNRTIYLTDEQNDAWKRAMTVVRDIGNTSVGSICVDALSSYADQNKDIAAAVRAAKLGTENPKDAKPEV